MSFNQRSLAISMLSPLKKLLEPFVRLSQQIGLLQQKVEAIADELSDLRGALEHVHAESRAWRHAADVNATENRKLNRGDREKQYYYGLHAVGILNYENYFVSGERNFLVRFLRQYPDAVVLDVGANIGKYAELVRELGPQSTIHCFEPSGSAFVELLRTAARIKAMPHCVALGDEECDLQLFDYADTAGTAHASIYQEVFDLIHKKSAVSTTVKCKKLDKVFADLGIVKIGLLKIDTEGHELAVLRGATTLLENAKIDAIQFEFNEMNVISRVFLKDFFTLLSNYRIYRLLSDSIMEFKYYDPTFMEVFAFQNIVCVRRDIDQQWLHGPLAS